jgi:hypothetical protein
MLAHIERNPSIPLDDLQAHLDSTYGVVFHISTISRTLNGIGIRNKRVCTLPFAAIAARLFNTQAAFKTGC